MSVPSPGSETHAEYVAQLVKAHGGPLLDYFVRRTPDREDAADLLGETLVVIWRRVRSVPADPTEARMWMFGVARRVLSQGRRTRARRHALTDKLAEHLREAGTREQSPVEIDVRAAIADLDRVDQEIIRLVYWDGFTLADAARLLDMNAATVRSRHARARGVLQATLSSEGIGSTAGASANGQRGAG